MDNTKTFFSYSRTDSDFVLKLAKDLRDAGADLWLDQLDIKPGDHWDATVESALKHSGRLIVVLSPTSVASNNVRDEVSFALENGKVVIPVLIKPCEVPFRWQRLQRVDLSVDYKTGLRQLLAALGHRNQVVLQEPAPDSTDAGARDTELERLLWEKAKGADKPAAYEHYLEEYPQGRHRNQAEAALRRLADRPQPSMAPAAGPKRAAGVWIIGAIVLVAAGVGVWAMLPKDLPYVEDEAATAESQAWIKATVRGDSAAYQGYLNEFPAGRNAETATHRRDSIVKELAKRRIEIVERERETNDSLKKVAMEKRKLATLDSIGIGKTFHGGKIFTWDPATHTGTILADVDPAEGAKVDWARAQQLCDDLGHGGFTDWRLPTIEELVGIHKTRNHDALAQGENNLYWSSTGAGDNIMRLMNFSFGSPNYRYSTARPYRVCAVRGFNAFERLSQ